MIRNLNQVTFCIYGSVLPERAQNTTVFPKESAVTLTLAQKDAPVYRATGDTWISGSTGTGILSVSADGKNFQSFYLDKTVRLNANILFSLSTVSGEATALMYTQSTPEAQGTRTPPSLRMDQRLRVDGIYTFFYQEKEQSFLFSGEAHAFPELTYVDQGSLHSVVDGQDLLLKQGDLVIYGPNQWHMQYADIGVAPRFITISFDLSGVSLNPLLNRKFEAPQQVAALLQTMLQELDRQDAYSSDIIVSQLNQLLLLLFRETEAPSGSKLKNVNVIHGENEIIRRAQQYVTSHIREKLSVPVVAKYVEVSPSYLTVLFHKNLQISPGEYIRRLKLQESKQMIRENNMTFTEIAAALQYSTVHHFSRQFKEKFGITPTEYAKSVR